MRHCSQLTVLVFGWVRSAIVLSEGGAFIDDVVRSLFGGSAYRQLRARRALLQVKDVPLRTRRALLLYKVYGDSALLVLNGTSLICNNALLALN